MLLAKLKNEIVVNAEILPTKTEQRLGNFIYVNVYGYKLGVKQLDVRVELKRELIKPLNPSSDVEGEGLLTKEYETIKYYIVQLNESDLAKWGTNDADLLYIVCDKLFVEIDEIIDVDTQNK